MITLSRVDGKVGLKRICYKNKSLVISWNLIKGATGESFEKHFREIIHCLSEHTPLVAVMDFIKPYNLVNILEAFFSEETESYLRHYICSYKVQYMSLPTPYRKNRVPKLTERKRRVLLNSALVGNSFNKVCRDYKITSEDGKLYLFTSHQLRHCGITDRVYAGFRLEDVRDMTNHKSYAMLVNSYIHVDKDELRKKQELMFKEKGLNSNKSVFFKGLILTSKGQEERLLNNPKANRIGNIGICSDSSNCSNGPTECLMCSSFIPDAEQLDYFEMQVKTWEEKSGLFKKNPIWYEHAINNIAAYQCAVEKIKKHLATVPRTE